MRTNTMGAGRKKEEEEEEKEEEEEEEEDGRIRKLLLLPLFSPSSFFSRANAGRKGGEGENKRRRNTIVKI